MRQRDRSVGIRFGGLGGACCLDAGVAGVAKATTLFSGLPLLAQVNDQCFDFRFLGGAPG